MFELVVSPESPCGCESGRCFGECCLVDGVIRLSPATLVPPPPLTGARNKKCFFSSLSDCAGKLSRDHIVSAAVLREISPEEVTISSSLGTRSFSPHSSSVTTKWVCERHNNAFSPLDAIAARFFRAVRCIEDALAGGPPPALRLFLFDGFDLERWALKTMLAAYRGRIAGVVPNAFALPDYALDMFHQQLASPYGMYFPTRTALMQQQTTSSGRHLQLQLVTEDQLLVGIELHLGSLAFRVLLGGSDNAIRLEQERATRRPKRLIYFLGDEVYVIGLGWSDADDRDVALSSDRDAPFPSNRPCEDAAG